MHSDFEETQQLEEEASTENNEEEPLLTTSAPLAELNEISADPVYDDAEEEELKVGSLTADENMAAAASKDAPPKSSSAEDSIFAVLYTVAKKVAIVGSIYFVGYMGWSVAWLIAPVILSVARDRFRKTTEHKRNIAKASAMASEKEVILARIDELPAWVSYKDFFLF